MMAQIKDPNATPAVEDLEDVAQALRAIHELVSARIALPAGLLPPYRFEWVSPPLGNSFTQTRIQWEPSYAAGRPGWLRWELITDGSYAVHVHVVHVTLIDTKELDADHPL